jgi:hypothetical protein
MLDYLRGKARNRRLWLLRTTDSRPACSPKERVAMEKGTRLKIGPVAVLVLLALLTLLVVKRRHLTAEEAADDAMRVGVKLEERAFRDEYGQVAFLALVALFGFVTWTALRAKEGEDKAAPPAKESSASGTTEPTAGARSSSGPAT